MDDNFKKNLFGGMAAVFGWIVVTIPKIQSREVSWAKMLAHIGVALLVGFSTHAVLPYVGLGGISDSLSIATASVAGGIADQIILLYQLLILSTIRKFKGEKKDTKDQSDPDNIQH
jgi:hypothetical protein